jgi:hypothetical protein
MAAQYDRLVRRVVVIFLLAAIACSRGARTERPVATLATTPEASAALEKLRAQWHDRKPDRDALAKFLERWPDDGAAPLVRVWLALLLMESGRILEADGLLTTVAELPPGSTRDLATIARARSLRLHGAPQSALESLRPLVGKIVDDEDREIFLEELALAAIGARDDYEALAYLDAWLHGVGEDDRDRVRAKIAQILETMPRPVLEQTYRAMRQRGASSGYSADTQKLVAARLARIAVDQNDAALARWLLEVSGTSAAQAGGDAGVELGDLASSRRGVDAVTGKTIGLLLPTRNRELRDEAADVVRGVSFALDLPRPMGKDDGLRLVTRDDGPDYASTRAALEELAGDGAAVILAGFDRTGADRAAQWSEQSGVPVLLLAAPSPSRMPQKVGAVLGERTERELAMLSDALVKHGVKTAALVVDTNEDEAAAHGAESRSQLVLLPPVRCDVPLAEAGKTRFPAESWLGAGATGWLVSGPTSCARDVLRDTARAAEQRSVAKELTFALTLEAGVAPNAVPRGAVVLAASAGLVPVLANRPEEAKEPDVRSFMDRFGVRPSYWTAIGHDGGALAKAALAPLPNDSTTDPQKVAQRRQTVQSGLLVADTPLWTTDERSVGADRVLDRALRIVTWKGEH